MGKRSFIDDKQYLVYSRNKNYRYEKKKDDGKALVGSAIVGQSKVA